jgi:hypothetical protein
MTQHLRALLRDGLKQILRSIEATEGRVFASSLPVPEDSLPALRVRLGNETVERQTLSFPSQLSRPVVLFVDVLAARTVALDDELDGIVAEVETAVFASVSAATLNGALRHVISLDAIGAPQLEANFGRLTMQFSATYFCAEGSPGVEVT